MLNTIWLIMMVLSVVVGALTGKTAAVISAATDGAKFAFTLALGLTAVMSMWLGIMRIAEKSGLIDIFTKLLEPLLLRVFSEIPKGDPAIGVMSMNLSANMLGLNNASTPFGIRAMEALEKLNPKPGTATNTMCTFIALHSSNLQLVPTTAIALLATAGALHPTDIVAPLLAASVFSVIAAIVFSKIFEKLRPWRSPVEETEEAA